MSTQQQTDIAALVGEMEDVACESTGHGNQHHGGAAVSYARVDCIDCGTSVIKSYCATMIGFVRGNLMVACSQCLRKDRALDVITILGPVNA